MNIIDVLKDILNIVGYKDDKDLFINNFLSNCIEEAYISLVGNLPKEALVKLNSMIDPNNFDKNYVTEIVNEYYTKDDIAKEIGTTEAKKTLEFIQMHMSHNDPNINEKMLLLMSNLRASLR